MVSLFKFYRMFYEKKREKDKIMKSAQFL